MGWLWKDHSSSSYPSSGGPEDGEEEIRGTRKMVRSSCTTEEVEPGKFVRRCEKTEQILRDCVGRPPAVIKSNTEHTEEDVTEEMTRGTMQFGSSELGGGFSFPGLRSDIETIERGMLGGLDAFLQAAEEMKNELFQSFEIPRYRGSSSFPRQVPLEEPSVRGGLPHGHGRDSSYDDFAGKVRDV